MAKPLQVPKQRGGRKPKEPRPKWADLMDELNEEFKKYGVPHIVIAMHPKTGAPHGGYATGSLGVDAIRHLLLHLAADLEDRVAKAAQTALLVTPGGDPIPDQKKQ